MKFRLDFLLQELWPDLHLLEKLSYPALLMAFAFSALRANGLGVSVLTIDSELVAFFMGGLPISRMSWLIFRKWRSKLNIFYPAENYVILIFLGMVVSMSFGSINYLVSRVDPMAFRLDSALKERVIEKENAYLKSELISEAQKTLILNQTMEMLQLIKGDFTPWRDESVRIGENWNILKNENVSIVRRYVPAIKLDKGSLPEINDLLLTTQAGADHFPLSPDAVRKLSATSLTVQVVLEALTDLSNQVASRRELLNDRIAKVSSSSYVPISEFVYESTMNFLGASPGSIKPAGKVASYIALVYAILKLGFFGMFLKLVVDTFSVRIR